MKMILKFLLKNKNNKLMVKLVKFKEHILNKFWLHKVKTLNSNKKMTMEFNKKQKAEQKRNQIKRKMEKVFL